MNNNMEIQREAIIEIVGTQYEGRAVNHNPLFLQQGLVLKHQSDNPHDHNAVLLLTEDGKELGFLPKGYASLYAPAIDSGRYTFSIEIVKAEPDPERPILIVKIISELASHSEEDIFKTVRNNQMQSIDIFDDITEATENNNVVSPNKNRMSNVVSYPNKNSTSNDVA